VLTLYESQMHAISIKIIVKTYSTESNKTIYLKKAPTFWNNISIADSKHCDS